ncbi:DUF4377 domain-containing protein [Spirosoma sp. BT702]|uniref:DUF4377 domain-containing protein n=1 Tax=Spirosoma profusum TaxID=2771354 RepID=A0A927AWX7_9BACT|nr:DUF4377 domain-containing protein [Spirosoma profusum]MBD2705871.1 DUF4377 domain-containing protein [Spirosoma profusum]
MNYIIRFFWVCLLFLFSACDKNDLEAQTITMRVAEQYKDCTGVGPQKCLWVKLEDDPTWTLHYSGIEGFAYEEGFEYTLTVKREQVKNPPMDGSSIRYILMKVVEKIKI